MWKDIYYGNVSNRDKRLITGKYYGTSVQWNIPQLFRKEGRKEGGKEGGRAEGRKEGMMDGREEGREGRRKEGKEGEKRCCRSFFIDIEGCSQELSCESKFT